MVGGSSAIRELGQRLINSMTNRDKQYHEFFTLMGYEFVYHPDKSGFMIKDIGYARVCDLPASDFIVSQAIEASKKRQIILLEGNLGYKCYRTFNDGEETSEVQFVSSNRKYYPLFYAGDYQVEYFDDTSLFTAIAINGDVTCHRCGSVNDFKVEKPYIHYKLTCSCGCFIKNSGTNAPAVLYFGKYQGREIASMKSNEELKYLQWCLGSDKIKGKLRTSIEKHLSL